MKQIFDDDPLDFFRNGVNRKMINFGKKSSESRGNQLLPRIMKILEESDEQITRYSVQTKSQKSYKTVISTQNDFLVMIQTYKWVFWSQ